jgi:putative membrane protein
MLAAAHFPAWSPHPDVWLLVALLATGYWLLVTRVGSRVVPADAVVSRGQVTWFALGLLTIGETTNFSVHMAQHMMLGLIAPPLLLLGTPGWMARWLLRPEWLLRTVRFLARFLPAVVLYNVVLVVVHWPAVVDLTLRNDFVHFLEHAVIVVVALITWLPIVSPMTVGSKPLYHFDEHVHPLFGLTTLDDQRVAGLMLKLGGGLFLWMVITIVFFRWFAEEETHAAPRRERTIDRELRELQEMRTTS